MKWLEAYLQDKQPELGGQVGLALKTPELEWAFQDRRFLSASTIKLPVLLCYFEHKDELQLSPYRYDPESFVEDSPFFEKCAPGQAIEWDTIADWMMRLSDNTATNLMIDLLGFERVSSWLKREGFSHTELNRKMVDLDSRARGIDNWTTPTEMCRIMWRLVVQDYPRLSSAHRHKALEILHACEDLEKIPFLFQPPIQVANKPGELPHNRSDVGYVHQGDKQLVLSVFCDQLNVDETADLWIAELSRFIWDHIY